MKRIQTKRRTRSTFPTDPFNVNPSNNFPAHLKWRRSRLSHPSPTPSIPFAIRFPTSAFPIRPTTTISLSQSQLASLPSLTVSSLCLTSSFALPPHLHSMTSLLPSTPLSKASLLTSSRPSIRCPFTRPEARSSSSSIAFLSALLSMNALPPSPDGLPCSILPLLTRPSFGRRSPIFQGT